MADATARVLVADTGNPSVVWGVHGAAGSSRWKCLVRGAAMRGSWEAMEWAWLPPGGLSGEHRHTRTEEVYLIVHGRGRMTLNDRSVEVRAGHLVLTGLGSRHSLRNIGQDGLGWLVIELLSPATRAVLNGLKMAREREEAFPMQVAVFDLEATAEVDPRGVFTGPLRQLRELRLAPSAALQLNAEREEHLLFVLRGTGSAVAGESEVSLASGVALALPLGTSVRIAASAGQSLRCFVASLAVSALTQERSS